MFRRPDFDALGRKDADFSFGPNGKSCVKRTPNNLNTLKRSTLKKDTVDQNFRPLSTLTEQIFQRTGDLPGEQRPAVHRRPAGRGSWVGG